MGPPGLEPLTGTYDLDLLNGCLRGLELDPSWHRQKVGIGQACRQNLAN